MFGSIPLLFASAALAQAPTEGPETSSVPPVVDRIEAKYADVPKLKMTFTQTVESQLYGKQTQTGTVAFARPGKMRWDFAGEDKHYISDGSTMWVYLAADKQAFKYENWDADGSPESLLSSLDNLDRLYTVSVDKTDDTATVLSLKPRANATYDHVKLALNGELVVQTVTVFDAMGTTTTLAFTDVELSPELPDTTFSFTPPEGVEVISTGLPQ